MVDDLQRLGFLVEVAEDRIAVEEDRAVDARSERALSAEADFAVGRGDAEVGVAVERIPRAFPIHVAHVGGVKRG